jgi:cytochrome c biogenesis protein CcdA
MSKFSVSDLVGYVVAAVAVGLGVAVIAGVLNLNVEPTTRYVFGAIFILIGAYRVVVTRLKVDRSREPKRMRDEDQ